MFWRGRAQKRIKKLCISLLPLWREKEWVIIVLTKGMKCRFNLMFCQRFFWVVFSKYSPTLVRVIQVKDSKTVKCQGLEEPLAAAGSWVPTKTRGAVGQERGCVSALTVQRRGHSHADPQCQGLIPMTHRHCSWDKAPSRGETLLPGGRCWCEVTRLCTEPQLPAGLLLSGGLIIFLTAPAVTSFWVVSIE